MTEDLAKTIITNPDLTLDTSESSGHHQVRTSAANFKVRLRSAERNAPSLGDYLFQDVIGKGSSGIVYRAKHCELDQMVAIKVFHKSVVADATAQKRFQREMETLARLSHPNIVQVFCFGSDSSGSPYMVTELIEGESVKDSLERKSVFEPKVAAAIVKEVCRGLAYTHFEGFVHRDITPANILVGKNNIAKIVDFGLAKGIEYTGETVTELGTVVGTPAYMSPEQCYGQAVDARSDIYSLGCIMFEMLTGLKAFESNNPVEIIAQQISDDRTRIRRILEHSSLPFNLQAIVMKCVERQAKDRFQSIAELEHDLNSFVLDLPLTYAAASPNRLKANAMMLSCGAFFLIVGIGYLLLQTTNFNPQIGASLANYAGRSFVTGFPAHIEIKNRLTGRTILSDSTTDLRTALKDASFKHVSLQDADLRHADLSNASFESLDLRNADLTAASFVQSKLSNVDLQGANLTHSQLIQAEFDNVNLKKAKLNFAYLTQLIARGQNLEDADLSSARLSQADLQRANCRGASFVDADLGQAHFDFADLSNAKFQGAKLSSAQFRSAKLNYANFLNATGSNVNVDGADLANAGLDLFRFDRNGRMSARRYR